MPAETALDVAITVIRLTARRDLEIEAKAGVQERNEEHTAADAEQRSQRAGDGARDHDTGDEELGH